MFDVIIVGGGAAGFYAAIHVAEKNPKLKIVILERGKSVLSKVKVSGGGRCNVTHAEFDQRELVTHYPRGEKELLGPFYQHAPTDIITFFESRGVPLKIEKDGRMFPESDSSQTIIDCFEQEVQRLGIQVFKNASVVDVKHSDGGWQVLTRNTSYLTKKLMLATGSNPKIWKLLEKLGHTIVPPVPSLYTFNIDDERIRDIQGISTQVSAEISVKEKLLNANMPLKSVPKQKTKLQAEGPLLITHWGFSGPAILKLSAWGARILNQYGYKFELSINWVPEYSTNGMEGYLRKIKNTDPKKTVYRTYALHLPKRLWMKLVTASEIKKSQTWAETTKEQIRNLALQLTKSIFQVEGKSTFKEEFVTAGGVDLKEIDFKTFESKLLPNLYFAGEIMNVDAITGGFNFQNAWTGAYIAAQAMAIDED